MFFFCIKEINEIQSEQNWFSFFLFLFVCLLNQYNKLHMNRVRGCVSQAHTHTNTTSGYNIL